jgi:YegS/Rv2252/BmrU family lipid kinase
MKTKLIVNPVAANGNMGKRFPQIEETLRAEHFEFDAAFTERRGHATEIARAALDAGCDLIVAVGGDGTLHEVVNGMFGEGGKAINPNAILGVITTGTGGDFVRTVGLPRGMLAAAQHLARATTTRTIDIGEVTYRAGGKEARCYFANVTGMGFDAEVIEETERGGKRGGGTIPYYTALLKTVSRYRNKDVTLQIDNQPLHGKMNSVVVCNGKYFGGGMCVGPNASLDDARFDVIIIGDFGTVELVLNTPRLYNGTILEHPKVSEHRAQAVAVESKQRMLIESDGELIGEGPAMFRIHPAALRVRV